MRYGRYWLSMMVLAWATASASGVTLSMVTVGNPGNAGERSCIGKICIRGAVAYTYQMGKYEVTTAQYTAFLNAVAKTDTYGLYNPYMWSFPYAAWGPCKIQRSGAPGSYSYSVAADYANRPVNFVSFGDAARFVNWLSNGQPTGGQTLATTEDGSYYLNGATVAAELQAVTREPDARFVIPTEDEWYKAAYHKNNGITGDYWDYPTSSDVAPGTAVPDTGNNACYGWSDTIYYRKEVGTYVNSSSPYGTFDQGGNLAEWNESINFQNRAIRGGSFNLDTYYMRAAVQNSVSPDTEAFDLGLRVVELPEPGTLWLLGFVGFVAIKRRRNRY